LPTPSACARGAVNGGCRGEGGCGRARPAAATNRTSCHSAAPVRAALSGLALRRQPKPRRAVLTGSTRSSTTAFASWRGATPSAYGCTGLRADAKIAPPYLLKLRAAFRFSVI
jgi:hypothetical protein